MCDSHVNPNFSFPSSKTLSFPALGRAGGLLSCWTGWGAIGASWAFVDAHIRNTLFVLFFFHPLFLISFVFLIGLTDHSSVTAVRGWSEECSGWDPWKSIPKETNLQGKNKLELGASGGRSENNLKKAQNSQGCSFSFHNRFANVQMNANTNTETIKLAWWKTSTKLFTWPSECLNPASTFSFSSIKMFIGNKNQLLPFTTWQGTFQLSGIWC